MRFKQTFVCVESNIRLHSTTLNGGCATVDEMSDTTFGYVFPAIRGIQARREYYTSMCPLRLIPKIILFDEEELPPEMRAQRVLNKGRIPEMSRYILGNRENYVFSAITASIDADVRFEPVGPSGEASKVGLLHVPMDAKFIINDGQHRRAAIEAALRENPEIGDESIAVVFFLDKGLARCQQMFADLNRYAIRPSRSIGVLYDHRDVLAAMTREVVLKSAFFRDIVEMERSSLSPRSRKLFTLSAFYGANASILEGEELTGEAEQVSVLADYWEEVAKHFPEWALVRESKMSAGEVRQDFIHSHGIVLHALGKVGHSLITSTKGWKRNLKKLGTIDWARSNASLWEGRALSAGRVTKAGQHVELTANAIKLALGMRLSPEERRIEDSFKRGNNG
jgi:DNA sulfur modification protein DndB